MMGFEGQRKSNTPSLWTGKQKPPAIASSRSQWASVALMTNVGAANARYHWGSFAILLISSSIRGLDRGNGPGKGKSSSSGAVG